MKTWKKLKNPKMLSVFLAVALFFSLSANVLGADGLIEIQAYLNNGIKMTLNGKPFEPTDPSDGSKYVPITYKGRTYLPLRAVAEAVGMEVLWDANTNTAHLGSVGGEIQKTGLSWTRVTPEYGPDSGLCDRHQILFIADEVMTGMGRTGKKSAIDYWGVVPDIMALGKGMSAGYTPMAAMIITDEIYEVLEKGSGAITPGHTYCANPQSAATALAVVQYAEKHNLVDNAYKQGEYLQSKLEALKDQFPIIGDARGLGLLRGLEFVKDRETKEPFPLAAGTTSRILKKAFDKGLILYPAAGGLNGAAGDAIIVAPPLVVTQQEIDELISILSEVLSEMQREIA